MADSYIMTRNLGFTSAGNLYGCNKDEIGQGQIFLDSLVLEIIGDAGLALKSNEFLPNGILHKVS